MSDKDPTTYWIKFFTDAGIPTTEAADHAVTFVKNRITDDMLLDLTKEYLNDMGITMMGDVIAILRHAKSSVAQSSKSKLLKGVMINPITGSPMRSTAASRTVAHYLRSADDSPKPISLDLATRLGTRDPALARSGSSPSLVRLGEHVRSTRDEVPVPKARRVLPEHEGKYKVTMPTGSTVRSRRILKAQQKVSANRMITASSDAPSVFSRLGAGASSDSSLSSQDSSSVFSRLGGAVKRAATSTVPGGDSEDEDEASSELEYHGVLKSSPAKKQALDPKKIIRTVNIVQVPVKNAKATQPSTSKQQVAMPSSKKQIAMTTSKQVAMATTSSSESSEEEMEEEMPSTEGIFSPFSTHAKKSVSQRLGKPVVAEAQSSTGSTMVKVAPKVTQKVTAKATQRVTAKPVEKVTKKPTGKGVQSRLGPPASGAAPDSNPPPSAKPGGVFSRLGKQHLV